MFGLALIAPFLNVAHDIFGVKVRENGGAREVGEVTEKRNNSAEIRSRNAGNGVNIPRTRLDANNATKLTSRTPSAIAHDSRAARLIHAAHVHAATPPGASDI